MFAHHTMTPDTEMLYQIVTAWKEAVNEIADVKGLYPTFVTNIAPASAARVALTNGVGNVWGLPAESTICKTTSPTLIKHSHLFLKLTFFPS